MKNTKRTMFLSLLALMSFTITAPGWANEEAEEDLASQAKLEIEDEPLRDGVMDSGECGECLNWTLSDDGVLTITGSGPMNDYDQGEWAAAPWYSQRDSITSLVIEEGVMTVGQWAFYNCTGLSEITLPNSLTSISAHAFDGCKGLTEVALPNNVESLEHGAFYECTGLLKLILPDSVTKIGNAAFEGCESLIEINIPNGVTRIDHSAFFGCVSLTEVYIPASVTNIDAVAFGDCKNLEKLTVSEENAVYHSEGNCIIQTKDKKLVVGCKNSIIPADGSVTSIGNQAFHGCIGLTEIAIPNSVSSIGGYAFSSCTGLAEIEIPSSITSIRNGTFRDCTGLTKVSIPSNVTSIETWAFFNCTSLTDVLYSGTETQWQSISIGEDGNEPLGNATIYYNSSIYPGGTTDPMLQAAAALKYLVGIDDSERPKPEDMKTSGSKLVQAVINMLYVEITVE